jgi:hypothetical protein
MLTKKQNKTIKKTILLLVILFNFSCDAPSGSESTRLEYVCDCNQIEKVSQFIQSSIKSANNMSDEEMEDVIKELHKTAVKVHCERKNIKARRIDGSRITVLIDKLDSCERVMENIF